MQGYISSIRISNREDGNRENRNNNKIALQNHRQRYIYLL